MRTAFTRTAIRAFAAAAVAMLLAAVTACSGSAGVPDATAPPSPSVEAVPGWPSAMAAIGHSGLTAWNSEGTGVDVPGNSWATGDNPDVDSVYLRILAKNPAVEGHATNIAVDGSGVVDLLRQAQEVAQLDPRPDLVIIQSIDNDMQCDGTDAQNLPHYRDELVKVMDVLTTALPDATVFFASIGGSVPIYDAAVVAIDPGHLAGNGPCDTVDPVTLQIAPDKEVGMQAIIDQYFGTIVEVCAAYENCITDENAMQSIAVAPEDLAPDLNHFAPTGQAKMAATAWHALYPGE